MNVYLVGAGPGDPGLLTCRAAKLLSMADVVLYDRLVDPRVLAMAHGGATLIDVGKQPGKAQRQQDINAMLVEQGSTGKCVIRLKGGDPFLFGRGGEEAEALQRAGVLFEVVPGVSSSLAAPAYAGIPVTHRGMASSVTVVTGHVEDQGGSAEGARVDWESLGRAGGTLVILMGIARRAEIACQLVDSGRDPSTPVAVVQWGTTRRQRTIRTTLADLGEVEAEPPSVIVVGSVAALSYQWFELQPLHGLSVVVTRSTAQAGELSSLLDQAGADVVELPVIEITDPSDAGEELSKAALRVGSFAWVVFTSANAVQRFLEVLGDVRALAGTRLAAVGPATAGALASRGLVADIVAPVSTAEGLVAAMPAYDGGAGASDRRGTVLFPRAEEARDVLAPGLRAKGWEVEEVVAYRTVCAGCLDPRMIAAAGRADLVTFASPSAVRCYVGVSALSGPGRVGISAGCAGSAAIEPGGAISARTQAAACTGPVTADAAREAGFDVVAVAETPVAASLVDAIVAWHGASAFSGEAGS